MSQDNYVVISIESQKGGIGKTTTALNLARILLDSKNFEVLLIDLDMTGTEAGYAVKSSIWEPESHIVNIRTNEKEQNEHSGNLLDLYEYYLSGEDAPKICWKDINIDDKNADKGSNSVQLIRGKINIFSSYIDIIEKSNGKNILGPNILFDKIHSAWFIEMLKEIVKNALISEKKLAVLFDNSPGYSGLRPQLDEWLTDLGPQIGKFLYVCSIDGQDIVASIKSLSQLISIQDSKWKAAIKYRNLINNNKSHFNQFTSKVEERFFMRLASKGIHNESNHKLNTQQKKYNYYYETSEKTGKEYSTNYTKWWGVIFNVVPLNPDGGTYKYEWKEIQNKLQDSIPKVKIILGLFKSFYQKYYIPYSAAFSIQFLIGYLTRSSKKSESKTINYQNKISLNNIHFEQKAKLVDNAVNLYHTIHVADRIIEKGLIQAQEFISKQENDKTFDLKKYYLSWRYTLFVQSKSNTIPNYKITNIQPKELQKKVTELSIFITAYIEMFPIPQIQHHVKRKSRLYNFVCSSVAVATIIRSEQTNRKTSKPIKIARAKMCARFILFIEALNLENSKVNFYDNSFWGYIINNPTIIRKTTKQIIDKFESDLWVGRVEREFSRYSESMFQWTNMNDDTRLISIAANGMTQAPDPTFFKIIVGRILEETFLKRKAEKDRYIKYLEGSKVGQEFEMFDPAKSISELSTIKMFDDAIRPILKNWDIK
jgi:cellulose biosynthesis protein BcsQ